MDRSLTFWLALLSLFLAALSCATLAAPTQVSGGRLVAQPDGTQLVFDLDQRPDFVTFTLDNPPRYVVDIKGARLAQLVGLKGLNSADIRGVRTGVRNDADLRIVLDLRAPIRARTTLVRAQAYHLVIDFFRGVPTPAPALQPQNLIASSQPPPAVPKPPEPAPKNTAKTKTTKTATAKPTPPTAEPARGSIVVAIDPGHGGRWPGAVGPGGTLEKDVTLPIARRLAALINRQQGMRGCLTRSQDKHLNNNLYRDLYRRIDIARTQCKADLFISLHADGHYEPSAQGASVYVLSTRGASSASARWLAQHENQAGGAAAHPFNVSDEKVRKVVIEMVQNAMLVESQLLAAAVLVRLGKINTLHSDKVESAEFVVLKAPDIPSILVETAFISNAGEERKLLDPKYQQRLAQAVFYGIHDYLRQRPQLWPPEFALVVR